MVAARDPELSLVFQGLMDQFGAISEEAVAQLQPEDRPPDRELVREQASVVVRLLGGFLFQLANGLARLDNSKQLERYLHAVIAGWPQSALGSVVRAALVESLRHSGLTRIRPRAPAPRTRSNASAIRFSPSTGPIIGAGSTVPLTNAAITSRNSSGV
jgi:hypothetical protein